MTFRAAHRYLSLVVAALWIFQAATGILVVFRWELDDATVHARAVPFDAAALGNRLDVMSGDPDVTISSVWSSGAKADRFDIFYNDHGKDRTLRVDGRGDSLRDRSNDGLDHGNIYDRLSELHMALMLGSVGRIFIGLSGLFLISNIVLGLKLAWPRMGQWLKAVTPPRGKSTVAIAYGWHRMLGLVVAVPSLVTIIAGAILAFDDPLTQAFKADVPEPAAAASSDGDTVRPSVALNAAMAAIPGSTLSGFSFPDDKPWYRVRVRAPGEMPRIWGMTTIFVSSRTGAVMSIYDARRPHAPARFLLDLSYPLHTGQLGGIPGRMIQVLVGVWLIVMATLGITLWLARRKMRKAGR